MVGGCRRAMRQPSTTAAQRIANLRNRVQQAMEEAAWESNQVQMEKKSAKMKGKAKGRGKGKGQKRKEKQFEKGQKQKHVQEPENEEEDEEPDEPEEPEEADDESNDLEQKDKTEKQKARKRRKRRRTCQKKTLSDYDKKIKVVKRHLAALGVTWQRSQYMHSRRPVCPEDMSCKKQGGFLHMQKQLAEANLEEIKCKTCLAMLSEAKFDEDTLRQEVKEIMGDVWKSPLQRLKESLQSLENSCPDGDAQPALQAGEETMPLPIQDVAPGEASLGAAELPESSEPPPPPVKKSRPKTKLTEEELQEEEKACIEFIGKMKVLEILQPGTCGKKVPLRCKVCKSSGQPNGKVFECHRMIRQDVEHWVDQHLRGTTHMAAFDRWRAAGEPSGMEVEQPVLDDAPLAPCEGASLTHGDERLSSFKVEFKLWASHSKLSSALSKHQYKYNLASEELLLYHSNCSKFVRSTSHSDGQRAVCRSCSSGPHILTSVKNMIRFCTKYWLAKVLHSRLFRSDEAREQLLEELTSTNLYRMHKANIDEKLKMNNGDLQTFVRNSFMKIPKDRSL